MAQGPPSVQVRHLAPGAIVLSHRPPGAPSFRPERPWFRDVFVRSAEIPAYESRLVASFHEGRARVLHGDRPILSEAEPVAWGERGSFTLQFQWEKGEIWFGGGPRFESFGFRKGEMVLQARESPALMQGRWSYSAIPFFVSSRGFALFLMNSHRATLRIHQERGVVELRVEGPPADYLVIHGNSVKELLSTWTSLTGRPPLPPRWALGLWATAYPQEHQNVAIERIAEHRRQEVPLDVVILDYHWEKRFNDFQWRPSLFPDPARYLAEARRLGVRTGLIFAPFLNRKEVRLQKMLFQLAVRALPPGADKEPEAVPEIHEKALKSGHLLQPDVRWWFGVGGMIDFTNPEAARNWNRHLRALMDQGVELFKNDDGEYVPPESRCHLGIRGEELHNLYGLYYGRAIFEGMGAWRPERRLRPFIYARSVWAGSQRYPAYFLGDQNPTFHHLRATLRAGLNMSLCGFSWWTADIFGLFGKTSPETHARYAAWGLFCPIARYFWRPPSVDGTRFPWSHGERNERAFRELVELRYRLLPYFQCLAHEAAERGWPVLRPLFFEWPEQERAWAVDDQFMLGDALLFAPVVREGERARTLWLPPGSWYDLFTGDRHEGDRELRVEAPVGSLPIFAREGAILPMGPLLQHIPDEHRFAEISLHLWPPFEGVRTFYDDDGRTRDWVEGAMTRTELRCRSEGRWVRIEIGAIEGSFPESVAERTWEILVHAVAHPLEVRWMGEPVAWERASFNEPLRVRVRAQVAQGGILELRL